MDYPLQVNCETQDEVDYYWSRLSQGGDERAQQCGWLKDRYGVSWQVVPSVLPGLLDGPDVAGSQRAMMAMLQMKKIDIDELMRAYAGQHGQADRAGDPRLEVERYLKQRRCGELQ